MKRLKQLTKKILIIIFVIWLFFLLIPIVRFFTGKEILNGIDDAYVMAGALFTGWAFAVTFASLLMHNKALQEQLAMDTLANTINLILDSERFRESRKYVMSKTFYNHIEALRKMKDDNQEDIYIEDWKKIGNDEGKKKETDQAPNNYEHYEKLIYFCNRMEYLGITLKNKEIDNSILDFFGSTIITSYKRLEPYIENSRKQNGETYYFHYTYLNYLAKQREPKLKQDCREMLEKMSRNVPLIND